MRRKKYKRTLDDIGRSEYDFDFQQEIIIYKHLCYVNVKRRIIAKLDEKVKFSFYRDWKRCCYWSGVNSNIISRMQDTITEMIFTICISNDKIKARLLKGGGRNGFQYE